jgi:serine/threonine protein kinase
LAELAERSDNPAPGRHGQSRAPIGRYRRDVLHTRTLREARLAARLSHPGIVTIHDIVTEDDRPWIVMELISARSLDEVIEEDGPLEPRRVAEIGLRMVGALTVAHEAGRCSPTSASRGRRATRRSRRPAGCRVPLPTSRRKRARGRPAAPASDLWSLGATLYCAVEGRSPFERPETVASLVAVMNDALAPMERAGPLRPVIEGLLRKDPEERLTAAEAAETLGRIVAGGSSRPVLPGGLDGGTAHPSEAETDEFPAGPEPAAPEPIAAAIATAEPVTPEPGRPAGANAPGRTRRFKAWQPLLVLSVLAIVADVVIFAAR